VASSLSSS